MPSATTSSLKKRKREPSPARELAFKLASHSVAPGEVGPVLESASKPSVPNPPPSTAFRCYRKKAKTATEPNEDADVIVVGETDAVEFESNEEESRRVAGAGCRYVIAVHNKRTSALTVLPTAMSPYILTHTVKALKSIEPAVAPAGRDVRHQKGQGAIRARERNRVDVGAMEGVMDFVMAGIDKAAEGLMTKEEAKEVADSNRPVPPFSATATDPADVYPLHGIIPSPSGRRFPQVENCRSNTPSGKILFYISSMMAFRRVTERKFKKEDLPTKLAGVPGAVIDSLLARFAECPRGSTEPRSTPALQLKLLTHMFALCLRVDNYAADHALIASDLSLSSEKINSLFKSLGCKLVKLGERERTRLGLPDSVADEKRAVLTAPVEFPKQRLKKQTR
ncbi:Rpa49 subunit specific to nuclear RNA polymerase I [Mycena sp. CBHHK59/15]|nr:Rpa49 subunit specific to nuclear RNA polymerase I [Mycena sp. CBHHK59/15]